MKKWCIAPERRLLMSKIFCDVCGTSYPDTSDQCPICGNLKSNNGTGGEGTFNAMSNGYAYVKGGRFSHANVRKRNGGKTELPRVAPVKAATSVDAEADPEIQEIYQPVPVEENAAAIPTQLPQEEKREPEIPVVPVVASKKPEEAKERVTAAPVVAPRRRKRRKKENYVVNIDLMLIVILLVLAILGTCVYITISLLRGIINPGQPAGSSSSQQGSGSSSSQDITQIPCEGLQIIPATPQTFASVGQTLLLEVKKYPGNTTDPVVFTSSDPYIASVDATGKITAVADGNVTIIVTCGGEVAELQVTCQVGKAPEYPDDPPQGTTSLPTHTTTPLVKLELQHTDITMSTYGETSNLYAGQLDPTAITWISEDETVATVTNGIVKAVGHGTTKIIAQYGDQKVECIIRCSDSVVKPEYFLFTQYGKLSAYDVTIKEGESLTFFLKDADGNKITEGVTYSVSDETYLSVTENGKIKGLEVDSTKTVYLYIEYEGVVYKCTIRIRNVS